MAGWLGRLLVGGLLGAAWACGSGGAFGCVEDDQCIDGGIQGSCHASGYCAFPDDGCESGLRFGDFGPIDLAKSCVPLDDGTGSGATSAASVSGGDSSPGATDAPPSDSTGAGTTTIGVDPDSSGDAGSTGEPPPLPDPITVTFGERDDNDVTGVTRDTFLVSTAPDDNYGGHVDLHFGAGGGVVVLLGFDITAIPIGSVAVEGTLELVAQAGASELDGTMTGYALLEAWDVGDLDGGLGAASWNERIEGDTWINPGAGLGSHDPTPMFEFAPVDDETTYAIALPPELLQAWIDDPSTNHGLVLRPTGIFDLGWFYSMDAGDPSVRPSLSVTYVPAVAG